MSGEPKKVDGDLRAPSVCEPEDGARKPAAPGSALWIGVGVVFVLMALAWTAMFFFASKYRAESVPLETPKEEVRP